MESDKTKKKAKPVVNILFRVGVCLAVIFLGVMGMSKLASLKKPPAESPVTERRLRVEIMKAHPENVPVFIAGYGEVRVLNEVAITPEVSGKIVAVHPRLEAGEIIPAGDTLFEIDAINYQAAFKEAKATVAQWQSTIHRLQKQSATDTQRLKTLQRNRDLTQAEFERIRKLYEVEKVGTRSGVERAEQVYNSAVDQVDQMTQAVTLYPIRIKEAQSSLAAAQARLLLAEANLDRCQVKTAFTGRIKSVNIEKGQYVAPGQPVITLADDATLEIQVPLDTRDARQWLRFDGVSTENKTSWFTGLENLTCTIHWTEDKKGHFWQGQLNRVVNFDPKTRTITVAIRVDAKSALSPSANNLPLVEGMFVEVRIPGRALESVYRLPREAVSFENTAFISVNDRLKTVAVQVVRTDDEFAYISNGLNPGDMVITTRLIDPMENALLEITHQARKEEQS